MHRLRLAGCLILLATLPLMTASTALGQDYLYFNTPRVCTVGAEGIHFSEYQISTNGIPWGQLVVRRQANANKLSGAGISLDEKQFSLEEFLSSGTLEWSRPIEVVGRGKLTVSLAGEAGAAVVVEVRGRWPNSPPQAQLSANPPTISTGQKSTLAWTSFNATSLAIEPGIGPVEPSGVKVLAPAATTTYTLTASGPGGTKTVAATVTVSSPPPTSASLAASKTVISAGETVVLSWSTVNAQSAKIEPGIGPVALSGAVSITPAATTTYTLTAVGGVFSTQASATVTLARKQRSIIVYEYDALNRIKRIVRNMP